MAINGNNNDNILLGTPDHDLIYGYGGDDTIYAGAGFDELVGGSGADALYGGSGSDFAVYTVRGRGSPSAWRTEPGMAAPPKAILSIVSSMWSDPTTTT